MLDDQPMTKEELLENMKDWHWRITSGHLYKIMGKSETASGETDEDGEAISAIEIPFIPNEAQMLLLNDLHNRNIILKARQMGFSTLIEIMALDHALFNKDQSVVITAHTVADAKKLMRTKVQYAYDRLPAWLRKRMPTETRSKEQMIFGHNGSVIEVTTSARGGTVNFLHVSEMGKIAAKFPDKAEEITSGSLQAVPKTGLCFIESTAEGQAGVFYELARLAENKRTQQKLLNDQEYNFHFFAWWQDPSYRMDPSDVIITAKDHDYFDDIEGNMGCMLDLWQRAWYVTKRDEDFAHEPELMWREYPSTSEECWKSSIEGKYLVHVLRKARKEGRIGRVPHRTALPVNSFWDLGASDDTVVWLHQLVNGNDHWIGYREATLEGHLPMIRWMEDRGCVWGAHYVPHDASQLRKDVESVTSTLSQVRLLRPSWDWQVVPRVATIQHGIDLLRTDFDSYYFDEENCKDGLKHLENYSREFNNRLQVYTNMPRHDEHSHAADAIRQKAQGFTVTKTKKSKPKSPAHRSGLTA